MSNIKVIIKQPNEQPYITHIRDNLEDFQNAVGGYIETVTLATNFVIICNEEGQLLDMPYCCTVCGLDLLATVIFAGVDEDEFADVPLELKDIKLLFPELWEVQE